MRILTAIVFLLPTLAFALDPNLKELDKSRVRSAADHFLKEQPVPITAQSSPDREYEETWHKAEGLLRALP